MNALARHSLALLLFLGSSSAGRARNGHGSGAPTAAASARPRPSQRPGPRTTSIGSSLCPEPAIPRRCCGATRFFSPRVTLKPSRYAFSVSAQSMGRCFGKRPFPSRLMNNQLPPPLTPTSISTTLAGGWLNFSWPSNYLGCRLRSNAVSLMATDSWFTVPASDSTNQILIPFDTLCSNVFFRLAYP